MINDRLRAFAKKLKRLADALPIRVNRRFFGWILLILASLVFAQALRLPASYMTFVFVLLFPLMTAIQLILARIFIRSTTRTTFDTVEKRTPFTFMSIVSNNCLFPFPFVEAELMTPDARGARCIPEVIGFSLAPLGSCEVEREAKFSFRGVYTVGLSRIWVYDCFRVVKIAVPCDMPAEVFVLPRRFELEAKPLIADSDQSTRTVLRRRGSDNTELSDLRSYMPGDSPKSVHWKLSSKSNDLIVRDYSMNAGNSVFIVCDLEGHYASSPSEQVKRPLHDYADVIDLLCADRVVEHALAAALRELRCMNTVTLLWLSRQDGALTPHAITISTPADFDAVFRSFASAELLDQKNQPSILTSTITGALGSSLIIVSTALSAASTAEISRISSAWQQLGAHSVEFIYAAEPTLYVSDSDAEKTESERLGLISRTAAITLADRRYGS